MTLDKYINIKELAEYLGVAKVTIYNLVKAKKLPQGIKIGGVRRWNFAEIKNFLEKEEATQQWNLKIQK